MKASGLRLLVIASSLLLGFGLVAPSMVLYPSAGELTELVRIFQPQFGAAREISILQGIKVLLREHEIAIGLLLLVFSVLFPLAKLGVLWRATLDLRDHQRHARSLVLIDKLAKFSMLDILVIALIVIAIKRLPGGTRAEIGIGAIAFALSVFLSMLIPALLKRVSEGGPEDAKM